jgi:hypothetical protein
MNNGEIIQTISGGLIVLLVFIAFFFMFGWAALKGDLIFRDGRIRGRLARVIGVIGLLGVTAGAYLAIGVLVFDTQPPFASLAGFLFVLFFVVALGMRFLTIFSSDRVVRQRPQKYLSREQAKQFADKK